MSAPPTKMVKSAQRVMELLEFFDAERTEVTVMDLVRVLDYPQSSASELLRCLASLGYLSYDRYRRTYRPTARVPLLGSWVDRPLFRNGSLLSTMDKLAQQTGDTVVMATVDSFALRYIHAVKPSSAGADIRIGSTRSPFRSALGRMIASHWQEKLIQDVVRRLNAEETDDARQLRKSEVIADLQNVAALGYAVMPGEFRSGHGMVAIALPGDPEIAVGLTFPDHAIREASDRAALLAETFVSTAEPRQLSRAEPLSGTVELRRTTPIERMPSIPPIWQSGHYQKQLS